jgi:hypothetical protein
MIASLFTYGSTVSPAQFFNRRQEIRRLLSRLAQGGSTAVVGQPHTGKTSLLHYIQEPEIQQQFTGQGLERCLLRFLDGHALGGIDQPTFWHQALIPLAAQFSAGPIHDLYAVSQANKFGTFTLEKLFAALQEERWQLALLLDEFDSFLNHPQLNNVEFYGGLRSLSSRYNSLALVVTTRRSLDFLNQSTQKLNPHGSPYFNTFNELRLGPLPQKDAAALLAQAGDVFDKHDRQFLVDVSGRQPYLLQLAADCLWHTHHEGERGNKRYEKAANELYDQARPHLNDTWRAWSDAERKVVTAVALNEIPYLAAGREFQEGRLIQDITDYSPELRGLEKSGTISKNKAGVWLINQEVMLWWLTDEIKRATRDDTAFAEWLQRHQFDGLFTNQERERWGKAAQTVTGTLGKGVTTLIESFSKGFGEGVGKAAASRL